MYIKMCVKLRLVFVINIKVLLIALLTDVVRLANARVFYCYVLHKDKVNYCRTALVTLNCPALRFSFFVQDTGT